MWVGVGLHLCPQLLGLAPMWGTSSGPGWGSQRLRALDHLCHMWVKPSAPGALGARWGQVPRTKSRDKGEKWRNTSQRQQYPKRTAWFGGNPSRPPQQESSLNGSISSSQDRGSQFLHPDPWQMGCEPLVSSGVCHNQLQADPHHWLRGHGSHLRGPL